MALDLHAAEEGAAVVDKPHIVGKLDLHGAECHMDFELAIVLDDGASEVEDQLAKAYRVVAACESTPVEIVCGASESDTLLIIRRSVHKMCIVPILSANCGLKDDTDADNDDCHAKHDFPNRNTHKHFDLRQKQDDAHKPKNHIAMVEAVGNDRQQRGNHQKEDRPPTVKEDGEVLPKAKMLSQVPNADDDEKKPQKAA